MGSCSVIPAGCRVFWGDDNIFKSIVVMVAQLGEYTKSH